MTPKVVKLRHNQHVTHNDVSPITNEVPIPEGITNRRRVYPFEQMRVGDSFTFPADKLASVKSRISVLKRTHPRHAFVRRREGELIRIWRIK